MKLLPRIAPSLLLWLGPVAVIVGIVAYQLWKPWPVNQVGELLVLGLLAWGLAALAGRLTRSPLSSRIAMFWVLALMLFAGPWPVLATLLLCLAAIALGGWLQPQGPLLLQAVLGLLLLAATVGWLLPLPLHTGWGYLLLCAALVAWRWRALMHTLRNTHAQWNQAIAEVPTWAGVSVLIIGLAGVACWLPTLQYDDLVYHLRLPWQLQQQGFYDPAPQYQVWALAPWMADVVQALAQLMSGAEARGPVNALWLVIMAGGLWQLSRHLDAPPLARWLGMALAVSLPLTSAQASGMHTELPTAAALSWLFALTAGPQVREHRLRFWLTLAVLAGGLMGMKLTSAMMALIPLFWALCRHPWPAVSRIPLVGLAGLAVAGSSYLYAWQLTGNPVLPLFNGWFQSPYFSAHNFLDERWVTGFGPLLFWNISFDTPRYVEALEGGGGFLLIALAGPWLISLLHRPTRMAALAATVVLILPLLPMQYLRYAYPGLMLLSAILVTAAFTLDQRRAAGLVVGLCVLQLSFQANAVWMMPYGAIKQTVKALGRDAPLFKRYAQERVLIQAIRQSNPATGNVLMMDGTYAFCAELGNRCRTISWYSPTLAAAAAVAHQDASGQAWVALMQREHIREVILRTDTLTPPQRQALDTLGAIHKDSVDQVQWWSIPAQVQ